MIWFDMETIEEQLKKLRERWVLAKYKGDTVQMRIIEIKAKLLKKEYKSDLEKNVEEVFLK